MNREKRFEIAAQSLASARAENRDGSVILVEGKRDVRALKQLGFSGPIEQLNRGWPVDRVVVWIVENFDLPPIVLMDWDRTGGRLQRKIGERLEAFGMKVDHETRMELVRSMKPEGKTVECLKSHAEILRPYIDQVDNAGFEEE